MEGEPCAHSILDQGDFQLGGKEIDEGVAEDHDRGQAKEDHGALIAVVQRVEDDLHMGRKMEPTIHLCGVRDRQKLI